MRSLAGLVLALAMTGTAAAADLAVDSYSEASAVLLAEDVVVPARIRVAYKQHCSSCGLGLPWGGLYRNRYVDLPWGGVRSSCIPVRAIRINRSVVVRVKG